MTELLRSALAVLVLFAGLVGLGVGGTGSAVARVAPASAHGSLTAVALPATVPYGSTASVSGMLTDAAGAPVAGAPVVAEAPGPDGAWTVVAGPVATDAAGAVALTVTPVVFWGGADPAMDPNPDEVLSVHRVSFRELQRPDSPRFVTIAESDRPVVQIPVGGDLIHAPTGAVLLQFRRVALEGVSERVADYEQPVFAWR